MSVNTVTGQNFRVEILSGTPENLQGHVQARFVRM